MNLINYREIAVKNKTSSGAYNNLTYELDADGTLRTELPELEKIIMVAAEYELLTEFHSTNH